MKIFILIFLSLNLYSFDFKLASYNVENLFDLKYDGTEYKQYKANSKYWHKKALRNKLTNISRVINDLNADILCLQEVESQKALDLLLKKLPQYKYSYFLKKKTSAIGLAIISKFKIISNKTIYVNKYNKYTRPILKSSILVNGNKLIIYNNHWKSKRTKESSRIPYAQALFNDIKTLKDNQAYVIVGDLNSNYDEYISFKNDTRLNDTYGITGINQVLNTSINKNLITKRSILNNKLSHYNSWLEIDENNRYSATFKGRNNTPDNILLPKILFQNSKIKYKNNSFNVFKANYLFKNGIYRWNLKKYSGFSDHLPIFLHLTSKKQKYLQKNDTRITKDSIDYLYTIQNLNKSVTIKDVIVILKDKNKVIIKRKNSRAILIYLKNNTLKLGYKYDLKIHKIQKYYGTKEISKLNIIKEYKYIKNFQELFLESDKIDLFNALYQNDVLKNIVGIYKNKYLYLKNKRVKLYLKKGLKYPKNNSKILLKEAHITNYKSTVQINIYKQNNLIIL